MTVAIISLLAALIPFVIWLVKRKAAQTDDPVAQHAERNVRIEEQLLSGDSNVLTAGADDDLAELDRLRAVQTKGGRD